MQLSHPDQLNEQNIKCGEGTLYSLDIHDQQIGYFSDAEYSSSYMPLYQAIINIFFFERQHSLCDAIAYWSQWVKLYYYDM